MKLATNGSAGEATSSAAVPTWSKRPSRMTPTRPASAAASSKSWVTRSVGSASSRRSPCSSTRTRARVCASSAASGSSGAAPRVARERPREADPLALAARQLGAAGPARGARCRSARAARRRDAGRRRRRCARRSGAGRARSPGRRSRRTRSSGGRSTPAARRTTSLAERDPARGRAARGRRPRAAPSSSRRRTGRRARRVSRPTSSAQLEAEGAERDGEVETSDVHPGTSLTASSSAPLTTTRRALIASATSKSTSNCS